MYQDDAELASSIFESIPDLYALMIIDRMGNLLSYLVSDKCSKGCSLSEIKEIARLVSIRVHVSEFKTILGPIKAAINIFENHFMVGKLIPQNKILVVTIPQDQNLIEKLNKILQLSSTNFEKLNIGNVSKPEKLKVIPSGKSAFQECQEKLLRKTYTLVASAYNPNENIMM